MVTSSNSKLNNGAAKSSLSCVLIINIILLLVISANCVHATAINTDDPGYSTYLNKNSSNQNEIVRNYNIHTSTLDVLYLTPKLNDDIYTLNEKKTFGNEHNKGWILPSEQPMDIYLYLYYEGSDERKLFPFLNLDNQPQAQMSNPQHTMPKTTLYMFFTPEPNCNDYFRSYTWPLQIVKKIAPNMYKAKLDGIVLVHSDKPLHICMQQLDFDENIHDTARYFSHQGTDYWVSIITTKNFIPFWARIVLFVILLCLSGLFSGLNLGLMSLDLSEMEILKNIGTPEEQSYVNKIYPLRKRGNFLLCTILLGNVLVNSTSTLLLGDMLSGVYAALGSTLLIVIFGEIIPQAACSKHGLAVGAYTRHITYLFMFLTCPLSFPISKLLDIILGQEISATYSREKIRELMKNVDDLGEKELKIISGALDFNKKTIKKVMTDLDKVFMLEKESYLDFETIAKIAQEGYSRIPVYEGSRDNVVGLLHVKDFTLLDPDDSMPVKALLEFYNHKINYCYSDDPIDQLFEEFRKGESHLAFVKEVFQPADKDPYDCIVGIVTMEDILEELVQMEIYDEFDDKKEIEKEEQEEKKNSEEFEAIRFEGLNGNKNEKDSDPPSKKQSLSNAKNGSVPTATAEQVPQTGSAKKDSTNSVERPLMSKKDTIETPNDKTNRSSTKSSEKPQKYETQASHDLSFFVQQQKEGNHRTLISPQIRFVMFQFLFTTVKPFTDDFLTKNVLELIFKRAVFKESRRHDPKSPVEYLYTYGKGCNYFILILSGEATIEVGKEKLEFPAGPFAYFGVNALLCGCETADHVIQEDLMSTLSLPSPGSSTSNSNSEERPKNISKQYMPDFSLRVDDRCVYMKIDRDLWRNGVIKSRFETSNNQKTDSIDYFPSANALNGNSEGADAISSSSSPHFLFKGSYPKSLAIKNTRRSTLAVDAFSKAQEVANLKQNQNRDIEMTRLRGSTSKPLQQLVETDYNSNDSIEKLGRKMNNGNLEAKEKNNSVSVSMDEAEKQPFLTKKYSNSSQTLDKKNKLADKYTTLSQKSFDD